MPKVEIINPLEYSGWDELLLTNGNYSFFHSSSWARVLYESYNYNPVYFASIDKGILQALIPVMEIKSLLTGKRGVSLPFTDYCQPIVSDKGHVQEIIDDLIKYGEKAGWKCLEWRCGKEFFDDVTPSSYYYIHALELSKDTERIFSSFRDSTKRNIKKAIKGSVEVSINNSPKSIKEFYRLNCVTRKYHGLPPQPFYFFRDIYDYIILKNQGILMLASYNNKVIGGAILFSFGKRAIYKYGAMDRNFQHLRPNNLIMWQVIKWYAENGYKSLCFGKTEPENKGLLQYKRGWGTSVGIVKYYKYDLSKGVFVRNQSKVMGFHNKIFNKMPIPLLRIIGTLFYKHMG